jgi:hypothetical protein
VRSLDAKVAFNQRDIQSLASLTEPGFEMKSLFVAIESDARGYVEFPRAYFEQIDEAYEHPGAIGQA